MALDRYVTLGRSGLRVSQLCLGAMTFGEDMGWGSSVKESQAILDRFIAAGGNKGVAGGPSMVIKPGPRHTKGVAGRIIMQRIACLFINASISVVYRKLTGLCSYPA